MDPKIDFLLHEAIPDHRVAGRNCRADAPVGTVFTALCRRDFPVTAPGEAITSPEAVFVLDISLRLDAVEWYRQTIDLLPSGHTATLTLSGSGYNTVAEAVANAPDGVFYSLCTCDKPVPARRDA